MSEVEQNVVAPEILTALTELDKRRAVLIDLQPSVEVARQLQDRFQDLKLSKPMVSGTHDPRLGDILIFGIMSQVSDLQPVLEFLGKNGHRQTNPAVDMPEMSARQWKCGNISLLMILAGKSPDGKQCKYVEVGKREVPVFELQCKE